MRMKDTCISFRFDIAENVIFKVEGHFYKDINDGVLTIDNPKIATGFDEDDWMMFASKITLSF